MNINISFIDSDIVLSDNYVRSIEIENKDFFYRVVDLLNKYSLNEIMEDIFEKKVSLKVFIDFFNFSFNDKKIINDINKSIQESCDEKIKEKLVSFYKKLLITYKDIIKNIDLPLEINEEFNFSNLIKLFSLKVSLKSNLLDNLFSLIDIQRELNIYDVIVFVNLKQYLSVDELKEFYKYIVYNNVIVLLIDSQCYSDKLENEEKVIIDANLDEFVV